MQQQKKHIIDKDEITVDDLLEKIKYELKNKKELRFERLTNEQQAELEAKNSYSLTELCSYYDEIFLERVFFAVVKRKPDQDGRNYYLNALRNGEMSKERIIAAIRFSEEGKSHNISIKGLKKYFFLNKLFSLFKKVKALPFLLEIIYFIDACLKLPSLLRQLNQHEKTLSHSLENEKKLHDGLRRLAANQSLLREEFAENVRHMRSVENTINQLIEQLKQHQDKGQQLSAQQLEPVLAEQQYFFDNMYVAFEDKFRGTRLEIKDRLMEYLPEIKMAYDPAKAILDVGCGRGEWLELLKEHDLTAKGIDLNHIMIQEAEKFGLDVEKADVISYLKQLPDQSLSAITGFHLIEHLPFETLIRLFQESLRVLKEGGMVIFETPNPENSLVGSHFFYTDPTHNNPLVPQTMEFILQHLSYDNVSIKRLHSYADALNADGEQVEDDNLFYNRHFYSSMDYAVIAYKRQK